MAKAAAGTGMVGALSAFPRRLAAKALAARGGALRRGLTRRTGQVVFGRKLIDKATAADIEARFDQIGAGDARILSENGFLRALGLMAAPDRGAVSRSSLLEQSKLLARDLDLLALFDAFEHDSEPFSFRDLILAKKYAGLIAGGASWLAVVRSIHRSGPVASLTAKSLHPAGPAQILARDGDDLSELDGQRLLPLDAAADDTEEYFALAEAAEADGLHAEAAVLYGHCLALDPGDSVAAFNQANCYRALEDFDAASASYLQAIKRDPGFVEAWFNYAGVLRAEGRIAAAREHLRRAVAIDADYADAVYNLATLEFEAHDLVAARQWWTRYLELDGTSDWSRNAARGIAYIDLELNAGRRAGT